MENPERKKNQTQTQRHRSIRIIGGGGGDIGAVIAWGGAMAIASLVAAFAIKTRFGIGRRKAKEQAKEKEEQIKKTENVEEHNNGGGRGEENKARLNDLNKKAQMDSVDLVSAILGEKPKDDGVVHHHQDMVPLINYAIPAHTEIVQDPYKTLNPDVQEIIPFTKLKPEFLAGIVEECKSLVDGPVPLKEVQGPVERLILKPLMNQVEAEALLSPITEVEERDDEVEEHYDNYGEEEEEEDGESMAEVEEASDEIGENSSMNNDEAIWPAEMIEELTRELKGMTTELGVPQEKHSLIKENLDMNSNEVIDSSNVMNEEGKEKVVPVAVAQTSKISRSRTWMRLSMFVMFLLVILLIRFDAMSCVLREP